MTKPEYIVSACLVGINCRYNGGCTHISKIEQLVIDGKAIPVCPEELGGLPTPRNPVEIVGDEVKDKFGTDQTIAFNKGAQRTLEIAKNANIKKAILQSRSPSCGYGKIYDGSFSGNLIDGNGITSSLLEDNGFEIYTDQNWEGKETD
ncbi:DUF523 domain-containing protein [Flammeovirga kamogawensis]|uniref:DUF523 domain-containing protein n=1 Tax=Flammeovirga kamogawensis TaxID=373891 RepID=A0ABX8H257_9BACT|nr:DUF523 domain-containing protein [Flammeovirga kamogawensis]MBB6462202.1 uncharacterized protein YbbK (DUF523 family) [Flammeovirga kamogawensis]QWG09397.1 DUF523 domain-containing protein [Flammeovirga kamogawensis]TRX64915.1 DUF523 domain-containing protein [Flammeovirga kamogawensis]